MLVVLCFEEHDLDESWNDEEKGVQIIEARYAVFTVVRYDQR